MPVISQATPAAVCAGPERTRRPRPRPSCPSSSEPRICSRRWRRKRAPDWPARCPTARPESYLCMIPTPGPSPKADWAALWSSVSRPRSWTTPTASYSITTSCAGTRPMRRCADAVAGHRSHRRSVRQGPRGGDRRSGLRRGRRRGTPHPPTPRNHHAQRPTERSRLTEALAATQAPSLPAPDAARMLAQLDNLSTREPSGLSR